MLRTCSLSIFLSSQGPHILVTKGTVRGPPNFLQFKVWKIERQRIGRCTATCSNCSFRGYALQADISGALKVDNASIRVQKRSMTRFGIDRCAFADRCSHSMYSLYQAIKQYHDELGFSRQKDHMYDLIEKRVHIYMNVVQPL